MEEHQRIPAYQVVEGFALETVEGLIFTVKGLVHPADRSIAYLRYLPSPRGDRKRGNVLYRRVYCFDEQREILKSRFPAYIGHDSVFGMELQAVPWKKVHRVYNPWRRLAQIRRRGAEDPLEEYCVDFANLLADAAGISAQNLGVSGSLLLDLHRPQSDLDIVVYGEKEGRAVYDALRLFLNAPSGPVRPLDRKELLKLHASHLSNFPFADFARHQSRKVNEGVFKGIPYFIRFVKAREETKEHYGDCFYESLGSAKVEFQVGDDQDAIFTPCRYEAREVEFLDRRRQVGSLEVVSFRGRFSDQACMGERAVAFGKLERVTAAGGKVYHRVIVGEQPKDYFMSKEPGIHFHRPAIRL